MLLSAMALVLAAVGAAAAAAPASIRPGVPWNDTDGNLIDAHGAGLLLHAGRYYWYGSRRTLNATGTQNDGGIALYTVPGLQLVRRDAAVDGAEQHRRGGASSFIALYSVPGFQLLRRLQLVRRGEARQQRRRRVPRLDRLDQTLEQHRRAQRCHLRE